MTDEMTIQGQRPSATPYLAGGAIAGAAAGTALAKYANVGIPTQAYTSWEQAVEEVNKNDKYISKQIDKGGDNVDKLKAIKDNAAAVQKAQKAVDDITLPEGFEAKKELETYAEKLDAKVIAEENVANAEAKVNEKVFDETKKSLKELELKDGYEFKGKKYTQEEFRALLDKTDDDSKKLVKELVEEHSDYKKNLADTKIAETERKTLEEAKKAADEAKKAVTDAESALTNKDSGKKLTKELKDQYLKAREGLREAKNGAKKAIGEEVLAAFKKPSTLWTAVAGAVALGLGALFLRPSGEEEIA